MTPWTDQIDNTTNHFVKNFGSLSEEQLNWKPNAASWSIAQNIDHLIVINETYFPVLADLRSGRFNPPFIAKFGFIVTFLGKTILNASAADRKKKIKTFPLWEPSVSHIPDNIVERFSEHQNELKKEIESSSYLIKKKGVIISSPANKNIVYKLEIAFDIIAVHELRHLEQANGVLGLLRSAGRKI